MIPHIQTIFGDGSDGSLPGNCFQTAVASSLDLPLEDVPHFVAMQDWWLGVVQWVETTGRVLTRYEPQFKHSVDYGAVRIAPIAHAPLDKVLIASGQGPRGYRHAVLWLGGKLLHDPHPSGDGLVGEPEDYWLIERL